MHLLLNKAETQLMVERFLRYVKFDTRSDAKSNTVPSTACQVDFCKQILLPELEALGLSEIKFNEKNGFLTALLPGNTKENHKIPRVGFIAHVDTADFESKHVSPQIFENYQGQDLLLNKEKNIVLSPKDFENLHNYHGKTLITTDGTTLLGADDKAGIAEILTAVKALLDHPEIPHGDIKIAFGPDEEIGRGADLFDVEDFQCAFAYTMDGGPVGELEYESFHAAGAEVHFQGKNVHPGTAKNKMVNAISLAHSFISLLPAQEAPEYTEKREGFFHLCALQGTVEEASLSFILRDFDRKRFEERKAFIQSCVDFLNQKHGNRVSLKMKDQYYNMGEILEKDMRPVEYAKKAMESLDIVPLIVPIRGGTDGSKLSFMGLPTPNLFAGGENFHGRYEFVAVESMVKASELIVELASVIAKETSQA